MWKITKWSSVIGGVLLVASFGASGAPQQAAGAAIAIGLSVIPYVISRANQEIDREARKGELKDEILNEIESEI